METSYAALCPVPTLLQGVGAAAHGLRHQPVGSRECGVKGTPVM